MTTFSDLAVLAARELELVREGRWDEASVLAAEREALAPALAPAREEDRPALELLLQLQERLVAECALARDAAARDLAGLMRGRGAMRGYRSAAGGPVARIDGAA
jgi:hypothetical protein